MAALNFIDRNASLLDIEKTVKNKFKWIWLDERDGNNVVLSSYVRKLPQPGIAYCLHCEARLDYSKKGKSFIHRHANSSAHVKKWKAHSSNQSLPALFKGLKSMQSGEATAQSASPRSSTAATTTGSTATTSTGKPISNL